MKNDQYFKLSACIMANDEVINLTEELGVEGFGAFVGLLLELRQRDDYRCAIRSLAAIARRLNTSKELLLRVVYHFGLFCVDEEAELFSSPYLDEMMDDLEARRKRRIVNRTNGLKGGRPPKSAKEAAGLREEAAKEPAQKLADEATEQPIGEPGECAATSIGELKEVATKSIGELAEKLFEKPGSKPNSEPNSKPNLKPNSKPNSKTQTLGNPDEQGPKTQTKPSRVEKRIEEQRKEEKRTTTTNEVEVVVEADARSPLSPRMHWAARHTSKPWHVLLDEAFDDALWVEVQAMQSGCGMPFVEHKEAVKTLFRTHVLAQGSGERLFSSADVRSYFSNFNRQGTPTHLRIVELLKRIGVPGSRDDPYRYEQRHPDTAERSYCGCVIPPDAPPRPSENAVWSDELREWG